MVAAVEAAALVVVGPPQIYLEMVVVFVKVVLVVKQAMVITIWLIHRMLEFYLRETILTLVMVM